MISLQEYNNEMHTTPIDYTTYMYYSQSMLYVYIPCTKEYFYAIEC